MSKQSPQASDLVTVPALIKMKQKGRRITMLTAYDATMARLLDLAGVDVLLVGDSLGMVVQGADNTLSVSLEDIIYHTRAVVRGARRAHVVADMPFMSYQSSDEEGIRNAGRLIKEGGAHSVKLEGGARHTSLVRRMVEVGIPVMGHIGLTPQSLHTMGGYKVQGRKREDGQRLVADAMALEEAGVYALVLEGVPLELAQQISQALNVPTIGIGAGVHCDGQVLVINDLLGLDERFSPRFVKRYDDLASRVTAAVRTYCDEVRRGDFPASEHSFSRDNRSRIRAVEPTSGSDDTDDGLAETIPLYPGIRRA